MPHLIVEQGPDRGSHVTLHRDRPCHIGAGDSCDLRLSDQEVADRHVVVKALKSQGFGAKALGDELFGLNGQRAAAARIGDDDQLQIGKTVLRFVAGSDAPVAPAQPAAEPTARPRTDAPESPRAAPAPSPRTETAKSTRSELPDIPGFRLIEELGRGGWGVVYRAEQTSLGREVALKVLNHDLTSDPVFVARFVAEARAAARLHHPNVVQVFDVGHADTTYYYSMELMHEGSLEDRLEAGPVAVDDAIRNIADAARALAYAEELRMVHRDVKPDNLMLDQHGAVKLADLGLAMSDEDDATSKVAGTPAFMSPEQALRRPVDHRSDLYSLGCTFYRLVTGRNPFRGRTVKDILKAHVKQAPEPPATVASEVPAELSNVILRLLEKEPGERYQSAAELLGDLEALQTPPAQRGKWIAAGAVVVLAAVAAIVWGLSRPEGGTRVVIEDKTDYSKLDAAEQARLELEAENARKDVLLGGLTGEALAAALDEVAEKYDGTPAAEQARSAATEARAKLAAAAEAAAQAARASDAALQRFATEVGNAIAEASYATAANLLDPAEAPSYLAAVQDEDRLTALRKQLDTELRDAIRSAAETRVSALTQAVAGEDTTRIEAASSALREAVEGDRAWPEAYRPTDIDLAAQLATAKARVAALTQAAARAAQRSARATLIRGFGFAQTVGDGDPVDPESVLGAVDGFAFQVAAQRARAVVAATPEGSALATHVAALADSCAEAERFLEAFATAAASKQLVHTTADDQRRTVTGFATGGDQPGLTIEVPNGRRPKLEQIPLASLRGDALLRTFRLIDDQELVAQRAAFLGWLALVDHRRAVPAYIRSIDGNRPTSGTGEAGYPLSSASLQAAVDGLRNRDEAWAKALRTELAGALRVVRGLRAFSETRNTAAVNHLTNAAERHGDCLFLDLLH